METKEGGRWTIMDKGYFRWVRKGHFLRKMTFTLSQQDEMELNVMCVRGMTF